MSATWVFAFLIFLVAVGRALRQGGIVPASSAETINLVALYVCMPAAMLLNVPQLTLDRSIVGVVAAPWLLLVASVALLHPLTRLMKMDRGATACVLTEVPTGNTAFLGYSLVPALAGPGALRYAVVYDQFGSFMILATYVVLVVAVLGGGPRPTVRTILRRVLTFPAFVALVFAVTVMPKSPPASVHRGLEMLSAMMLPLVALGLGMSLKLKLPREHLAPLAVGMIARLVVLPVLALGIARLFGLEGDMRAAVVLESGMPSMMTTGALLSMAGLAPDLSAAIVGYTTVASMVTLPLVRHLLLP